MQFDGQNHFNIFIVVALPAINIKMGNIQDRFNCARCPYNFMLGIHKTECNATFPFALKVSRTLFMPTRI